MSQPEFHSEPPQHGPLPRENPFRDRPENSAAEIIQAELVERDFAQVAGDCGVPWYREAPVSRPPLVEPQVFHVPTRFGLSAIMGITTAMAVLFGVLRGTGAPQVFYLFFGVLSLVICVVQMRFGEVPRQASIIAGAVLLPLFVLIGALLSDSPWRMGLDCSLIGCLAGGAFLGYVTGTCLGGVFLLMDLFEKFWTQGSSKSRPLPKQRD